MKTLFKTTLGIIIFSIFLSTNAQTAGTLTFTFLPTVHETNNYGFEHVMAVWVQTNSGAFVKTKLRRVGNGTKDHLKVWAVNSGGSATNATSTTCNTTDATTGATLVDYTTKTIIWDGKNVVGTSNGTTVADGVYKVTIEETWDDGTSNTTSRSFTFTKGPVADHQTPAADSNFTNIVLDWLPTSGLAIDDVQMLNPEVLIYPNPSKGIYNIEPKSEINSIKIFNVLGQELYTENLVGVGIGGTKVIDLSKLENGTYYINVGNENGGSTSYPVILNK